MLQDSFPKDLLSRERDHLVEIVLEGNHLTVDLRTHDGRMAARMLAYSISDRDPGIARAILTESDRRDKAAEHV